MISEALNYPIEDEDRRTNNFIIGSLMVAGSIFIIPFFILLGYFSRAVKDSSQGKPLQEFGDYKGLFIDGFKLLTTYLVYFLGVMVLMFIVALAGNFSDNAAIVLMWILLVPALFTLQYALYVIPKLFSHRMSMRDALKVRKVVRTAFTVQYLKIFLLILGLQIGFSIIQFLSAITIIGLLLLPPLVFYELMVYAHLVSKIEA